MYCDSCGKQAKDDANFCAYCGFNFRGGSHSNSVKTGQGSFNVGVGNLPNANIHIGDKIQHGEEPILYHLERTGDIKTPIKAIWVFFAGAISFLAAFLDVLSNLGLKLPIFEKISVYPLVVPVAGLFLLFGLALMRHRFIWLQFFGLETDPLGFIHITRLKGTCPKCDATLSVKYIGPKNAKEIAAICSRNPEKHRFTFDPTELSEIEG